MFRITARIGDRVLSALCPRATAQAQAGPICDVIQQCKSCGYEGSRQKQFLFRQYSNCRQYKGPCLVANPDCQ